MLNWLCHKHKEEPSTLLVFWGYLHANIDVWSTKCVGCLGDWRGVPEDVCHGGKWNLASSPLTILWVEEPLEGTSDYIHTDTDIITLLQSIRKQNKNKSGCYGWHKEQAAYKKSYNITTGSLSAFKNLEMTFGEIDSGQYTSRFAKLNSEDGNGTRSLSHRRISKATWMEKNYFPDWSSNAERDSDGAAMSLVIMLHIEPAKVFCEVGIIHCGLLTWPWQACWCSCQ